MRPHLLWRAQKKDPLATGIFDNQKNTKINYSNYFLTCRRIQQYLQTYYNLSHNIKIALQLENSPTYALLIMGLQLLGAVSVHLSTRFPETLTKNLLANIFDNQTIKILITDKNKSIFQGIANLQILAPEEILENSMSFPFRHQEKIESVHTIDNKQWVDMTFTSGSEGEPKAVTHTYGNHYYSALGSNINLPLKRNNIWLICLPLFHVGGQAILYRTALAGSGVIFAKLSELESIFNRHKITHVSLVPTQLYRLLENSIICKELSKLKVVLLGGAHLSKNLMQFAIEKKINLYTSYGLSEMSSQVATCPRVIQNKVETSIGKSLPFRKVIITPEKEILVKGPCLFQGYYHQKKAYLSLNENGYFKTGDLGELSDEGYLTILGKKDNMFISGGENIYPEEIERELEKILYIQVAFVVGVSNSEFGMRPMAFIDLEKNKPWKEETFTDIKKQLEKKLPRFKVPIKYFRLLKEKKLKYNREELKNLIHKKLMI